MEVFDFNPKTNGKIADFVQETCYKISVYIIFLSMIVQLSQKLFDDKHYKNSSIFVSVRIQITRTVDQE